jgi:SpoVK/Ycf46/Vps4 family AAA+-type ATPase
LLIVDLPTEPARVKILETHLRGEELGSCIDLAALAKKTVNYSGSDLKNVCVAAAMTRMKECIIQDSLNGANNARNDETELSTALEQIDDWGSYLADKEPLSEGKQTILKLAKHHIEIGLKECPPSLSDEMQTLVELRKWDAIYGDGASRRTKGSKGIGFGFETPKQLLG